MSDGRTVWWPKDAAWWRREYIVALGEEHGAAGPAVLDWLCCEAKVQNDGGRVKAGVRSVARGSFVDAVTVGHVLSFASQVGAIDELEEADGRFTCRISGWKRDQARGSAAARKAVQRERESVEDGSTEPDPSDGPPVTERDLSRPVTPSPEMSPREEERREVKEPPSSPQVEKQLFDYWRGECSHPDAMWNDARRGKIRARLREGYSPEQIRTAIDGAAKAPFVNDKGKRHDELTLICRDGAKLEDFIDRAGGPQATPSSVRTTGRALHLAGTKQCKRCDSDVTEYQANNQSGLCDDCYQRLVEGAA